MRPTTGVSNPARTRRRPAERPAVTVGKKTGDYLDELAAQWPAGARVRHTTSAWTGTVTVDRSGQAPAITAGPEPAHGLLFGPPYDTDRGVPAVVCVTWDHPDAARAAWIRTNHLARFDPDRGQADGQADGREGSQRRRSRTRRRAAAGEGSA